MRESLVKEINEMTEKEIGYKNLYNVILKLDYLMRDCSGPPHNRSMDHLRDNKDAFERGVLRLAWDIAEASLEVDTVEEGSPWKGKAGLFPTHYGWPDATHLMWQYKHSDWKAEAKKPATE